MPRGLCWWMLIIASGVKSEMTVVTNCGFRSSVHSSAAPPRRFPDEASAFS